MMCTYENRDCDRDVQRDLESRISVRKRCTEREQPVRNIWRQRQHRKAPTRAGPPAVRNCPCNLETQCSCKEPVIEIAITHQNTCLKITYIVSVNRTLYACARISNGTFSAQKKSSKNVNWRDQFASKNKDYGIIG